MKEIRLSIISFVNELEQICLLLFLHIVSFTTFQPNFTSGLIQVIYRDLG